MTEAAINYGGLKLRKQAQAARLSISTRCLENWMRRGLVPYSRIGNVVLFDPIAVDAALAPFEVNGTRSGLSDNQRQKKLQQIPNAATFNSSKHNNH
jgi:hypothetical protein